MFIIRAERKLNSAETRTTSLVCARRMREMAVSGLRMIMSCLCTEILLAYTAMFLRSVLLFIDGRWSGSSQEDGC